MNKDFSGATRFSAERLSCSRGRRELFSEVTLAVDSGEVLIIQGDNGAGKTSLLRLLAGLSAPDDGTIRWGDVPIEQQSAEYRRALCYIGHQAAVKAELTVKENLHLLCMLDPLCNEADLLSVATQVGLRRQLHVHCRALSAGQKRRLNLARLLLSERPLWILDEPLTALDKNFIVQVESWIKNHTLQGGMVILSTHRALQLDNVALKTVQL